MSTEIEGLSVILKESLAFVGMNLFLFVCTRVDIVKNSTQLLRIWVSIELPCKRYSQTSQVSQVKN